jgi:L,D-transpeptidase ErfK/SrfK
MILSACTAFDDFMAPLRDQPAAVEVVEITPPEERPRVDPQSRNYFVLESPEQTVIGEPQIVFTREENTFSDLAREYGLGYDELVEANPDVDPWLPGEGTPVILPTQFVLPDVPHEGIVLNIAAKRLFYFPPLEEDQPQTVLTYPIGIGRVGWQTPLGSSSVISKARDPSWYVPASVRREHEELGDPLPAVVPPGPDNPLGTRVLKLDLPGYLIHGTNQPYGVGMRVSHGCVRLYPENIESLYEMVGVGVSVQIVNEPFLTGWKDGHIYFEGHVPLEDDKVSLENRLVKALGKIEGLASETELAFDLNEMRLAAKAQLGVPVILTGDATDGLTARARVIENTVEMDPDMPTLAEVRAILDAPLDEEPPVEEPVAEETAVDQPEIEVLVEQPVEQPVGDE